MHATDPEERAREYLRDAHLYRLGELTTEQPHPATRQLAPWARSDLPRAITVLKRVDLAALQILEARAGAIDALAAEIRGTLARGRRVFLVGCGATGRLALTVESLWRKRRPGDDRVRAFMAGGDVALVHALEGFEDYPAHGRRHLRQMGFADGDLLIACTEGGETPYVIGATEAAAEISANRPWFLYCNDDAELAPRVARFRRIAEDPRIRRLSLGVGPMALAGSTRMQASTVLQLAVGAALLHPEEPAARIIARLRSAVEQSDYRFLSDFVAAESAIYTGGGHVVYRVTDYGITVLTDTTERAPTFSLVPFERLNGRPARGSWCSLSLPDAATPRDAWLRLLHRPPRPLNWPEVDPRTTPEYLDEFDFSTKAPGRRAVRIAGAAQHEFRIRGSRDAVALRLGALGHELPVVGLPDLLRHLLLKQVLNIHSTLVMGRLGRYEGNLMTWVAPTNGKLVDRAARYVMHLLAGSDRSGPGYERVVRRLFVEMEHCPPGESVVLRTYRALRRRAGTG
jgi:N-acetylmuramic acid 6-phosphate etherase